MMRRSGWEELAQDPRSFEDGVALLLGMVYPGLRRVNGEGGDRGVDAVRELPGGERHIFQIKSFTGRLNPGRRRKIESSLDRAAQRGPASWALVLPLDLTPGEWDWFDRLRGVYPFPLELHGLCELMVMSLEHPAIEHLFRVSSPHPTRIGGSFVSDATPIEAGLAVGEDGRLAAYVERDLDCALRERLSSAANPGGAVLLVGDSAAGKTRTLYEAMRAKLSHHRFVQPAQPDELRQTVVAIATTPQPCVLWLDELSRYLEAGCFGASELGQLVRSKAVVLATLDAAAHERSIRSVVVDQMEPLILERRWSPAERDRARSSPDPSVVRAAQADPALGVAECLAVAPRLWRELALADRAGGSPRGAALTRAGIDLARAGLNGPFSTALLLNTHSLYLADGGGPLLRPESPGDALAWAGKVRCGASSMLLPAGEGTWNVHPQLIAEAQRADVPVHALTWFQAMDTAHDIDEMFAVALKANDHAPSIAVPLWRAMADAGISRAANNLGIVLADLGRYTEAERAYRMQADMKDPTVLLNLGNLLGKTGRYEEAVVALQEAGARGNAAAWNNLGLLLRDQGRLDHAETCLRSAALAGAADAEFNLGVLLGDLGRTEEAMAAYGRASAAGDSDGEVNWGILLAQESRWAEAEPLFRGRAEAGDGEAVFCLANLLKTNGRMQEAMDWYHRAIDAGDERALYNLANLYGGNDRPDLAEPLYRAAADAGVSSALLNLALLLKHQQRLSEAEPLFRQAAALGHRNALLHLGDVLHKTGRPDEAATHWRLAADAGDTTAAIALATVLTSHADRPYLRAVLQRAADAGDGDAALVLAALDSDPRRGTGQQDPPAASLDRCAALGASPDTTLTRHAGSA
ncbi:tetratricopeptide repeat protein [Streptomyces niveus]|uniref:tetratricopeptide repeat protein n=1 Tax=Streptomyces niveus TaxID=193462 RepID=UPI0036A968E8